MNKGMLLRKFYKLKILKQSLNRNSSSCDDMLWIYRFQSNITLSIWPALLMNRGMLLRQLYKNKMKRTRNILYILWWYAMDTPLSK